MGRIEFPRGPAFLHPVAQQQARPPVTGPSKNAPGQQKIVGNCNPLPYGAF